MKEEEALEFARKFSGGYASGASVLQSEIACIRLADLYLREKSKKTVNPKLVGALHAAVDSLLEVVAIVNPK